MKKGDAIAKVAKPIARGLDYFLGTELRNCQGCSRMQRNLNQGMSLADAFYDRFFQKPNDGLHNNQDNQ
jgi:hypothetical protein